MAANLNDEQSHANLDCSIYSFGENLNRNTLNSNTMSHYCSKHTGTFENVKRLDQTILLKIHNCVLSEEFKHWNRKNNFKSVGSFFSRFT